MSSTERVAFFKVYALPDKSANFENGRIKNFDNNSLDLGAAYIEIDSFSKQLFHQMDLFNAISQSKIHSRLSGRPPEDIGILEDD